MAGKAHLAQYGRIILKRMECPDCKRFAFILDGRMACCDLEVSTEFTRKKRMSDSPEHRAHPLLSRKVRKAILESQGHRCLYCDRKFGAHVYRKGHLIRLRLQWDHLVPFVYSRDNSFGNYGASCQVCNQIKSCFVFHTLEEARVFIHEKRESKGYTDSVSALREGVPRQSEVAKIL